MAGKAPKRPDLKQQRPNLRRARKALGYGADKAASAIQRLAVDKGIQRELGVDDSLIYKWEDYGVRPSELYVYLQCCLYDKAPAEIDLADCWPWAVDPREARLVPDGNAITSSPPGLAQPLPSAVFEDPYPMLRRQFLYQLFAFAAVGGTMLSPAQLVATPTTSNNSVDIDQFIHECRSSMSACWRLLHGTDLVLVPSVLVTWLPVLDTMLRRSDRRATELAKLATEGYILAGLVTVLQGHNDRAEWCCHQAVEYAELSNDPNIHAAALKHLATKYRDAQYPIITLRTYERAIPLLDRISPLLRSRIYLGLGLAHADCGNNREAVRYWELAQETFPHDPHRDLAFHYADCRRSSLHHYGGLIHLALGRPKDAWDTFAEATTSTMAADVPERTVIEIANCQATAAIAQRDLELATATLESAALGAARLQSPMRLRESAAIFRTIERQWPNDRRLRRLVPLFEPDRITVRPLPGSDEPSSD